MYTEKELRKVTDIIRRIAQENNATEDQVRADMEKAMDIGANNPNPAIQAKWKSFHYSGEKPTVEEFILWVSSLSLS